jgi:origin recognition complex subunit 4
MPPKAAPGRKRGRPRKDDSETSSKKPRLAGRHAATRSRDPPTGDDDEQIGTTEDKNDVYDFHDPDEPPQARTPSKTQPKLKGILTPSRRQRDQAPKSVAFDNPQKGKVLFEDHGAKTAKPTRNATRKPQKEPEDGPAKAAAEEEEEEDDDDEVCALCNRPDSKAGNQILFCDGCDLAVHQKCYGVPRIPRGDWLCKDCSQAPSSATENGLKAKDHTTSEATIEAVPEIPNFEQHLSSLKRVLLDRCTGRRRMRLQDQDEAYEKTFQLVQQTVLAGEGNSMLVIGARGCGKTTMVESVLSDIGLEHRDQFHIVRLNGFIHTDDKLALKDIWRQLGKEMEVEDDLIGKTNNYADTLASLLALLSHPSEISESHEGVTSKSVVFIIDEFDLFATHARQTLLYNLFDIAQARKAPIAVLGLTNRIDVVESLEKRVKSRFSHRYVYLSLPKTLPSYWAVCKQGLTVEDEDAKAEGLQVTLRGFAKFQEYWTKKIETLYEDQAFKDLLEYHYYTTKSVPAFLNSCVLPVAALTPSNLSLRFMPGLGPSVDPPDSKLYLLDSLSDLDLSLLIAAARLDIVAHTDTVNFAMAYDEYTTLIGRQRVQSATSGMLALGGGVRVWGRGVAETCWERLVSLGLLLPTGLGGRMCKVDVTLEEIPTAVKLNAMLSRWCKEL